MAILAGVFQLILAGVRPFVTSEVGLPAKRFSTLLADVLGGCVLFIARFVLSFEMIFETPIGSVHFITACTGIGLSLGGTAMPLVQVLLQQIGPRIALPTKDAGIRIDAFVLFHVGFQQGRLVEAPLALVALEGVLCSSFSFSC